MTGWDLILPFLRPIESLLNDQEISEILVNGSAAVFIEKQGQLHEVEGQAPDEQHGHDRIRLVMEDVVEVPLLRPLIERGVLLVPTHSL